MTYLIISLLILGAVAFLAGTLVNHFKGNTPDANVPEKPTFKQVQDMECCGQHSVCEKESLLAAISKEIEYYNDEELDRFIGTSPEDYSENEEEEFRDVLYTMREDEVAGWVRSLQLRGVDLPLGLRDEVLMIVGDRRNA